MKQETLSYPPALFDAFNAKRMRLQEIAEGFVVPSQYREIVGPNNAVIVGPRGSGKTTLLRMLEGEALMAWPGRQGAEFRRRITYSSVFVPADRLWASQLDHPALSDHTIRHRLGIAAFLTHTMMALVDVMLYRTRLEDGPPEGVFQGVRLPPERESQLAVELGQLLHLGTPPSLDFLASALELRTSEIARLLQHYSERSGQSPDIELPAWPYLTIRDTVTAAIRLFNRAVNQRDHRWALLFDEMELAPKAIHQEIIDALRGSDAALLLKLSFSPFDGDVAFVENLRAAMPSHDYREVALWYGNRDSAAQFSEMLLKKLISDPSRITSDEEGGLDTNAAGRTGLRPRDVFGTSRFDTRTGAWSLGDGSGAGTAYADGSAQQRAIARHYALDDSFRQFLDHKKIDPNNLGAVSKKKRAAVLRKSYPLLVFREAVLEYSNGSVRRRSGQSKPLDAFTGSAALFAILEGNPRWFKAVVSSILAGSADLPVSRSLQFEILTDASLRFEALLEMLPPAADDRLDSGANEPVDVLDVVNRIAKYFSEAALGRFTPDPVGSFIVDDDVPEPVVSALQTALNAGAIIRMNQGREKRAPGAVLGDIRGCRFRISYLLAIRRSYEVPIRLGREVLLSTILTKTISPAQVRRQREKRAISRRPSKSQQAQLEL